MGLRLWKIRDKSAWNVAQRYSCGWVIVWSLGKFGINVGCGGVGPPVGVQHEGVPDSAGFARGTVQRKGAACVMARDGVGAP